MAFASMASSRRSSRRLALRAALSGPWQAKQFSARIGRTSRLYRSRGPWPARVPAARHRRHRRDEEEPGRDEQPAGR